MRTLEFPASVDTVLTQIPRSFVNRAGLFRRQLRVRRASMFGATRVAEMALVYGVYVQRGGKSGGK